MQDKCIYIVHERLEEIPDFSHGVVEVNLRRNMISKMRLSGAETVESLDLSDNRIREISDLENVPNLKTLDVSYNLLTRGMVPRMGLEELYLISNDIDEIPPFDLPALRKLDMAVNSIAEIRNLDKCKALEELYLGGNKIGMLENVGHLERLRVLDVQCNALRSVDCRDVPKSVEVLILNDNRELAAVENIHLLQNLKVLGLERTSMGKESISGSFTVWH
jgi:protein phosphatase 1 regulatory subunit 7